MSMECIILFMTVKDDRLRCVKELVYAEEVYNDCLKSLFELYAEPLRYASDKCNTLYFQQQL